MASVFKTSRRVEFCDTDAAGLMHFSAFFTMMEQAEHEFLRSLGWSVVWHDEEGVVSWPRVNAKCDFTSAAKFEDVLDIEVALRRLGGKSVTYDFAFSRGGLAVAAGSMTAVCCRLVANEPPRSMAIPPVLAEQMAAYVAEPAAE